MLVRDWMSTNVITVNADDTMYKAIELLTENHISMMPVMEEGKLVGVVTDRDLKRASPSDASPLDFQRLLYHLARLEVGAIMNRYPVTIPDDLTVAEAAEVLLEHQISGCPVVDEQGAIKGIITKSDIFKVMIAVSGLHDKGVQFGFRVNDEPGAIKEVTDTLRRYGARLVSILSSYEKVPGGYRDVYIRVFNVDRDTKNQLLKDLAKVSRILYVVDIRQNEREIYPAD
ncbi:MAG: CBS and ACT domain-containing protein [Desulfomonilaceae bacterium]|nr:CBS and ACT domain-containing protein [Desulfomonilaceae bacterium]